MNKQCFESLLNACPIVAILRGITPEEVPAVCDVLLENGIGLLEIPLNKPHALECIAKAAKHCEGKQMVGAGTVLTPEQVREVQKANGTFIISPNTNPAVISETIRCGMLSMPGFLTPSEGFTALDAGAHYLKLFPAGNFGISYIKNIQAVIPAPIFAVGGISAGNLKEYLTVCRGAGIGGAIYKAGKSLEQIRQDTAAIVQALK